MTFYFTDKLILQDWWNDSAACEIKIVSDLQYYYLKWRERNDR